MPRRLINSDIFRNEKFGNLDDAGRVFFIGCFSNADDDGRLKASPKYLRALIFPYDTAKTEDMVKSLRDKCESQGLIFIYNLNGNEYLYLPGWLEHQKIRPDRYKPSALPAPSGDHVATIGKPKGNQSSTSGMLNLIEYNISKDNIRGDLQKLKKSPPEYTNLTKQVFGGLKTRRGYTSRNPAAEAKTIHQMLDEGFKPDEILKAYDIIKQRDFFKDKCLTMMFVRRDIHEVLKNGADKKSSRRIPKPEDYRDPEDM